MPTEPDNTGQRRRGGNPRDREPIALAMAAGRTMTEAAAAAGVSVRAVRRWLRDPTFVGRIRELRADMFARASGRLADMTVKAADVLGVLLDSGSEKVKRQAAKDVLELSTRMREGVDLADELATLRKEITGVDGNDAAARIGDPEGNDHGPQPAGEGDPGPAAG